MTLKTLIPLAPFFLLAACGVGEKSPAIITYACDNNIAATIIFWINQ